MADHRLVPLAALQHYAYCPRQCALIHNEQVWQDNEFTAQGHVLHQRVDRGEPETRRGVRYERGVLVNAPRLGVMGKLDLLEVDASHQRYTPVEYKRGKPKSDNWDRIQVCAQGMSLEEMRSISITEGALWYWETRHRSTVMFDDALREETRAVIAAVSALLTAQSLPRSVATKQRCRACSLKELCQPEWVRKDHSAQYISRLYSNKAEDKGR